MPYYFEFDPENRILRGRFDGVVTDELLREFYRLSGSLFRANWLAFGNYGLLRRDFVRRVSANDSGFGKFATGNSRPGASALHRCGGAWDLRDGADVRIGRTGYAAQSARGSHDEESVRDSGNHRSQVRADSALNVLCECIN